MASCSFVLTDRRPAVVAAGEPPRCTDTFWWPAADALFVAASIGWYHQLSAEVSDEIDRGEGDANSALVLIYPMITGVAFAASALHGLWAAGRCGQVKEWAATTPRPADAGRPGHACIPTDGGPGRCEAGARCDQGACVPYDQRAASPAAAWCASEVGALNAPLDEEERARRWSMLPRSCVELLRSWCGEGIARWRMEPDAVRRSVLVAETRPACRPLLTAAE
jgi:hypothetical protein